MFYGAAGDSNAQDAHEGIRPTDPARTPESVQRYLTPEQFKLYQLIWQRFMASQMAPAVFDTTTVDFDIETARHQYLFRATGSVIKFKGFLSLYKEAREEGEGKALEDEQALPAIEPGEHVPVREIKPTQHFTEPPPRFSEASLVKELERLGHRPPVHLCVDHLDAHRAALRRARAAPLLPDAARRERREGDGEAVPRRVQRRLHGRHGAGARQGRGGRPPLAARAQEVLRPVREGARRGGLRGAHPRGARPRRAREREVPALRRQARGEGRILRTRSSRARTIPRRASTRGRSRASACRPC